MTTKTSKERRTGRGLAAALLIGLLAGCGESGQVDAGEPPATRAPATAPTAASTAPLTATPTAAAVRGGRDLSKIDPCKLATPAEASAALGAPFQKTLRSPSRPNVIVCNFGHPLYEPSLHVSVVRATEMFLQLYEVGKRGGRPIPGLGDDAYATRDEPIDLVDAEVKVRAGDLIVGVAIPRRTGGSTPGDLAAVEARLAKLAGLVLARVQR